MGFSLIEYKLEFTLEITVYALNQISSTLYSAASKTIFSV